MRDDRALDGPWAYRDEALHDRQYDAGTSWLARRSTNVPGVAESGGGRSARVSADDRSGDTAAGERAGSVPRFARDPRSSGAAGPGRRSTVRRRPQSLETGEISRCLRQGDGAQLYRRDSREGDARNVLRTAGRRVRRVTDCMGLEL